MYKFETPGHVELRVENKLGDVRLSTHEVPVTEVEIIASGGQGGADDQGAVVEHRELAHGHEVLVQVPAQPGLLRSLLRLHGQVTVNVRAPVGLSAEVSTAAGDIRADGRLGTATLASASGDIAAEIVTGALSARSASGDISAALVAGEADLTTASGDVRLGTLSSGGRVKTASGQVTVGTAHGYLSVQSASGDVSVGELVGGCKFRTATGSHTVDRLVGGEVSFETVSGDLSLGVARGTTVAVEVNTISGDLSSEIELDSSEVVGSDEEGELGSPRLNLRARSVSGDVRIKRAPT